MNCRFCGVELQEPEELEEEICKHCMFKCEKCGSRDYTDSDMGNRYKGPLTYCPACNHWTDQWKAYERANK